MKNEQTLVFGINPVREKLKASSHDVLEILIADRPEGPALRSIDVEAKRLGLRVTYVSPDLLSRLTGGGKHQGVLAKVEAYVHLAFTELVRRLSVSSGSDWLLILDGLTDPRNFGALLRTAEAVGVRHIVIPKDRSVAVTPIVVKASAGAAHHVKIVKVTNLRRTIGILKEYGYWIVGLDAQSRESVYDRQYPSKLALVLGS